MTSSVVGPSGPRPGVERLAEVLRAHIWMLNSDAYFFEDRDDEAKCRCGWEIEDEDAFDHDDHLAAAIVAAIPSLPVEALAELVGGNVQQKNAEDGSAGQVTDFKTGMTTGYYKRATVLTRLVTPWRSVTSPEGPRS